MPASRGCSQNHPFIPHSQLLPRTTLNVTHGGGGTVVASLAAGVPMVIIPLMWDQPEIAQRVVHAGAGILIPPRKCTPNRVRDAVERILSDSSYTKNAKAISAEMNSLGGSDRAAVLLEDLAA